MQSGLCEEPVSPKTIYTKDDDFYGHTLGANSVNLASVNTTKVNGNIAAHHSQIKIVKKNDIDMFGNSDAQFSFEPSFPHNKSLNTAVDGNESIAGLSTNTKGKSVVPVRVAVVWC